MPLSGQQRIGVSKLLELLETILISIAFNYMVVQITPIGIETVSWKFYIIWIVFNASFGPVVYFFYPETAGRRLEDMDRLYRENHIIWAFKDKDAFFRKRPQKYIENDQKEIRRASVVSGVDFDKGSSDEEPSTAWSEKASKARV